MNTLIKCHGAANPNITDNLKFFTSVVALLLFLLTVAMPQPALSQVNPPCSIEKGSIGDGNTFTASALGSDFKITCQGRFSNEALRMLRNSQTGFVVGESKIILDVSSDANDRHGIYFNTDAGIFILTGTITNDATVIDGNVIVVEAPDPEGGTIHDVNVESHATITARGDGRRGLYVSNYFGGDAVVRNYGTIKTEGETYVRPPGRMYPHRDSRGLMADAGNGGDATAINESGASVTVMGVGGQGVFAGNEGEGDSTAINRGTVVTQGGAWRPGSYTRRAYGVFAWARMGNSSATNAKGGTIVTGDPDKIANPPEGVTGIAISGTQAQGLRATTEEGGSATVTNDGTITTHGTNAHGMNTWVTSTDRTETFIATGVNTGTITTHGDEADGASIGSDVSSDATSKVSVTNSGTVTTHGDNAEGIEAYIWYGDNDDDTDPTDAPGTVMATNSGTVTTHGDQTDTTDGLGGAVQASFAYAAEFPGYGDSGAIQNSGNAIVENTGTVNALGHKSAGLRAKTFGSGKSVITVRNGIVNAGHMGDPDADTPIPKKFGVGIYGHAETDSTGSADVGTDVDVTILVTGSSAAIRAYGAESDDTATDLDERKGIAILAETGEENGHSEVTISDGATVRAFSGVNNAKGNAVMFRGGKGVLNVYDSDVDGDIHFAQGNRDDVLNVRSGNVGAEGGSINFYGGDDELIINKGLVRGDLNFGDGDDTLSLQLWGQFNGDLDFGAGNDYLSLDVVDTYGPSIIRGDILGIETMDKICPGTVRILGDVNFEASALNLKEGGLAIAGVVDLNNGELTIYDNTKLTFEIGDIVADQDNYGRIVNAIAVFNRDVENPEISTEIAAALNDQQVTAVRNRLRDSTAAPLTFVDGGFKQKDAQEQKQNVDVTVTSTDSSTGASRKVGTIAQSSNTLAVCDPANANCANIMAAPVVSVRDSVPGDSDPGIDPGTDPGTGGSQQPATLQGGGSSGGGALLGLGLIAILLNSMDFDEFNEESAEFRTGYPKNGNGLRFNDSMFSNSSQFELHEGDSISYWVRSLTDRDSNAPLGINAIAKAQGTELGMNFDLGNGFKLTGSVIPGLSASDSNATMQGDKFQFGGSWRKGNLFSSLKVSHEDHDTALTTKNPVVNSFLEGNSTLSNTYLQLQAGKQSTFNAIRMQAAGSIFAGSMTQGAYTAESPALTANIPAMSHNYSGWKLGLNIAPTKMFEFSNGTRMLPVLKIGTMRTTTSGVQSMLINQSDRTGALGFNTNFGVRNLPTAINTLSFSSKYEVSSNSSWNFGFAGAEIDGEFESVALAKFAMKF